MFMSDILLAIAIICLFISCFLLSKRISRLEERYVEMYHHILGD